MVKKLILFIAFVSMSAGPVRAQEGGPRQASVLVEANFEATSGVGLLVSPAATIQKIETKLSTDGQGNTIVTFPYSKQDLQKGMVATAMVFSEQGDVAFGRTVSLSGKKGGTSALLKLPECKDKLPKGAVIQGQYALLEKLVEVRSKRRNYYRSKLKEILTDDFIARLSRLEGGLGLSVQKELEVSLNPVELATRLSALKLAIQSYEAHKAHRKKEASTTDE